MLPDRVLAFEEPLGKGLVDHRYLARRVSVLFSNRSAQHHLCANGFEEPRHHSRKSGTRIFLGPWLRPAFYANTIVPAIARHRRIERGGYHAHTGNLAQAIVNLPEHWLQSLRLVVAQHGIDRRDIPA